MVHWSDTKKLIEPEETAVKLEHESLIDKYKIPVQHFEYSYIENCKDGKELERIVQVLRSGQEGHFPDLTNFAEKRLAVVKPKSKLLRKVCPVVSKESLSRDERNEITEDLTEWVSTVSKDENELAFFKNRKSGTDLPQIREVKEQIVSEKKSSIKRISSTDYSSWDKYDPDTEILKMDLEEESLKKTVKQNKNSSVKKTVQFREFSTDVEASREANYEKEKGNEFFKTGDYTEALKHYTCSINCKPTLASFTNRALTNLKLKKYKNALDDCHSALAVDPNCVKAFLRKSQALDGMGRHAEALESAEQAVEVDPNNILAQDLAEKYRKKCGSVARKSKRFVVEEIEKDVANEVIIPIPGTSKMEPPHFICCNGDNPEKIREEMIKANMPNEIVHLVSIDGSEGDDDDGCTVDHLKKTKNTNIENRNGNEKLSKREVRNTILPQQEVKEDKRAGGEPYTRENDYNTLPGDIHSPYSFLKTWNSANSDQTLEQHAAILRNIDMTRIAEVIGCKLDNAMFSKILKCLCVHFAVPSEVDRLHSILSNIVDLPRFDIIALLTSAEDLTNINTLINFLNQHGKSVPPTVRNKFFNN